MLILLVVIAVLVAVVVMKLLNIGPLKTTAPATSVSTGQDQRISDSDEIGDIEKELNNTNVLGVNSDLDMAKEDLNNIK